MVKDILIIGLITLVSLTLGEGTLRLFWRQDLRVIKGEMSSMFELGPQGLKRLKPGAELHFVSPEFDVKYRINSQRLRSNRSYEVGKLRGTYRILVLGDSFTFGAGCNYADTWPHLLEEKFVSRGLKVEVINAGVPGYGTLEEWERLKELYNIFKPDLVLLTVIYNDPMDDLRFQAEHKERTQKDSIESLNQRHNSFKSWLQQVSYEQPLHLLTFFKRAIGSFDRIYEWLYRVTPQMPWLSNNYESPDYDKSMEITRNAITQMALYLGKNHTPFRLYFIPTLLPVVQGVLHPEQIANYSRVSNDLSIFAKVLGLSYKDLTPLFIEQVRARGQHLHFRLDGHPNPLGTEYLAKILSDDLAGSVP